MSTMSSSQAALDELMHAWDVAPSDLRQRIVDLARPIGVEFREDLVALFRRFRPAELERFVDLWSIVVPTMRTPFVAFILTGDDPDGRFLQYLDQSKECQEAVDLAFSAHLDSLNDLGKALAEAERVVSQNRAEEFASLLAQTEKVEEALQNAEESLESITDQAAAGARIDPTLMEVRTARTALDGTRQRIMALAGIAN